jgi:thymidylate synthase (FAD)
MLSINIIEASAELMTSVEDIKKMPLLLEQAGRTCYKSESKITDGSAVKFVDGIIKRGHESVLEHCSITVRGIMDRACSHQLVRHRIAAYSQESQRYCNYGKGDTLTVIRQPSICGTFTGIYNSEVAKSNALIGKVIDTPKFVKWCECVLNSFETYDNLLGYGVPAEDARSLLPNCTKTEVVMTFNIRQWRHIFRDRAFNPNAQWQIRKIMTAVYQQIMDVCPVLVQDLGTVD